MSNRPAISGLEVSSETDAGWPVLTTCLWLFIWVAGLGALVYAANDQLVVVEVETADIELGNSEPDEIEASDAEPAQPAPQDVETGKDESSRKVETGKVRTAGVRTAGVKTAGTETAGVETAEAESGAGEPDALRAAEVEPPRMARFELFDKPLVLPAGRSRDIADADTGTQVAELPVDQDARPAGSANPAAIAAARREAARIRTAQAEANAVASQAAVRALRREFNELPETRVNFFVASTELTADSQSVLNELARLMRKHRKVNLDISGHTDTYGFELANLYLSQTRASTVRDYLIERGVSQYRMLARGFGESEPIADNRTASGRAQNRRIEFRFLQENQWI